VPPPSRFADAVTHNESLVGEPRLTRTDRDLLKEQMNKFQRQLFASRSVLIGERRKDVSFHEAKSLGAQAEPTADQSVYDRDHVFVAGHKRAKRGRKPLGPAWPRYIT